MDFSNKLITEEIKRNDVFDLKFYLELIKKYGKENVNNFFNSLFDVAEANERKKILNLYYPAYISMKLENFEANTDNCILLIDKFGETNINKYFSDLLTFAENKVITSITSVPIKITSQVFEIKSSPSGTSTFSLNKALTFSLSSSSILSSITLKAINDIIST